MGIHGQSAETRIRKLRKSTLQGSKLYRKVTTQELYMCTQSATGKQRAEVAIAPSAQRKLMKAPAEVVQR